MPSNPRRTKRSEKGLLTPDNSVVAIIDLQPQRLFGVANFDRRFGMTHYSEVVLTPGGGREITACPSSFEEDS